MTKIIEFLTDFITDADQLKIAFTVLIVAAIMFAARTGAPVAQMRTR